MYRLPESLRAELARPLGPPLPSGEAVQRAKKARVLATVGDITTKTMLDEGLKPRVMVVDGKTKRGSVPRQVREQVAADTPIVQVDNDAATITDALWDAVAGAFASKQSTLIEVRGEEDLATLPCVLLGPDQGVVAYGQPDQGIVLLNIDAAARERVRLLLKQMEGP